MLPSSLVAQAVSRHLDAIGICDHNSAENVAAVRKAGEKRGLHVLGGLEITSREEVHILGFFDDDGARDEMQRTVYANLPGENDELFFGQQQIVNERDEVIGTTNRLLIGSTTLSVEDIVRHIHARGGIAIASHVDRDSFSLIGQLGFVPPELELEALEVSPKLKRGQIDEYAKYGMPLVTFSDAHFIGDIGKSYTTFLMEALSFSEIAQACRGAEGKKVTI
jgi:predicted metal-dependent phosphoesterase TrpH